MNQEEAQTLLKSVNYWHYPFRLPWATMHTNKPNHDERHQQRWNHFFQPLLEHYNGSLSDKSVLDLGCCQGFWSFEAEKHGAAQCKGIDSSSIFITQAKALQIVLGYNRCSFKCFHLENEEWYRDVGVVDLTFFLGLFYHLADPIFVLRKAMECTRETIIIDTEVLPREEAALFIMPRDPLEPTTCLSNLSTKIRLLPTRTFLETILADGGFTNINVLKIRSTMPEEYLGGLRLTIMAHRDSK